MGDLPDVFSCYHQLTRSSISIILLLRVFENEDQAFVSTEEVKVDLSLSVSSATEMMALLSQGCIFKNSSSHGNTWQKDNPRKK